jgi:serine/threonine-protein kinase
VLTAARVPDVLGMAAEQAADMIERAGFVAEIDLAFSSEAPPGTVASQQPSGGTEQTRGTAVVIIVATEVGQESGTAKSAHDDRDRVPNVVGLTELRATELLENGGYRIQVDEGYSASKAQGVIFEQSPDSGQYSPLGTTVEVYVSLGPPPPGKTQVPNVMGLTPKKAVSALKRAGLDPRSLVQWNEKVSKTVFQQDPAAGMLVPLGSKVFILSGE